MMWDYITGSIRALDEGRSARLALPPDCGSSSWHSALGSPTAWPKCGVFPTSGPRSTARLVATLDRPTTSSTKMSFESPAAFFVTANPTGQAGRGPAARHHFPAGPLQQWKGVRRLPALPYSDGPQRFLCHELGSGGSRRAQQLWDTLKTGFPGRPGQAGASSSASNVYLVVLI